MATLQLAHGSSALAHNSMQGMSQSVDEAALSEAGLVHGTPSYFLNELEVDDDGRPKRTGTFWTASAHIVTAVIGSGVLSLAWSMAKLGWIAGPICLTLFALVTYYTSLLLADCYRGPSSSVSSSTSIRDVEKRNYTYMEAVRVYLGPTQTKLCALVQYTNFVGIAIGYTITSSISMVAIARSNCFHVKGHGSQYCDTSTYPYMLLFGGVQVVLSQIPTFSKLWWLSIVAAVMSFSYSSIGVGLGIGKVAEGTEGRHIQGTLRGLFHTGDKFELINIWPIFQSLGNIAFAYSYSMILIEIQDTVRSPPREDVTMKRANLMGVSTTTFFYMLCGCIGYAAFGDDAPGNLLTGFGFYEPFWLVDLANVCVVVHLVGAFQVFCQPLFAFVEEWAALSFPKSKTIHKEYRISFPLAFKMHIAQGKTRRWSRKWLLLQGLSIMCFMVSLAALVGSLQGVVEDLKRYKPFSGRV
ncbi:hypothetical protein GOP47_0010589 [Adiantum capillus-veneris]|uniref:Amino acid transporter transmembrane domain-containing protein n=1 Tax=Adiantum capillus-veneris TaxID=13818 RepID=A0A9D4UW50_ADICA|nr:hypothetical protein GOP47_0010589 [Adiantum capillus-veneris]